ncbi:hypothetical protein [Nocardia sp. CA-119907]|uniref:hypothetical protein n=1 Tax=Nocardia sp. CA-119907 TaxID=3239973 RepID=UPI003D96A0B8
MEDFAARLEATGEFQVGGGFFVSAVFSALQLPWRWGAFVPSVPGLPNRYPPPPMWWNFVVVRVIS